MKDYCIKRLKRTITVAFCAARLKRFHAITSPTFSKRFLNSLIKNELSNDARRTFGASLTSNENYLLVSKLVETDVPFDETIFHVYNRINEERNK